MITLRTNDDVVRHIRTTRGKQIEVASRRAAEKVIANIKKYAPKLGARIDIEVLSFLIEEEFKILAN